MIFDWWDLEWKPFSAIVSSDKSTCRKWKPETVWQMKRQVLSSTFHNGLLLQTRSLHSWAILHRWSGCAPVFPQLTFCCKSWVTAQGLVVVVVDPKSGEILLGDLPWTLIPDVFWSCTVSNSKRNQCRKLWAAEQLRIEASSATKPKSIQIRKLRAQGWCCLVEAEDLWNWA